MAKEIIDFKKEILKLTKKALEGAIERENPAMVTAIAELLKIIL